MGKKLLDRKTEYSMICVVPDHHGTALTIGERVLQTLIPYLGIRGSVIQGQAYGAEVDDTPAMESFAEGYQHAQW
jgi:hypothetical protein